MTREIRVHGLQTQRKPKFLKAALECVLLVTSCKTRLEPFVAIMTPHT